MKRLLTLFFMMCLMFVFTACDNRADELEQLKIEFEQAYAKYAPYEELIDALIADDYNKAEQLIDGYRATSHNNAVSSGAVQEVIITSENWKKYFTVQELTEWTENDLGEATGFITHVCIVMNEDIVSRFDPERTDISFGWQATCSVKNCDVDLENHMVAFENVFKSNSTTFGDPETLTGTVTFDGIMDKINVDNENHIAAKIGEIVIVGEYSLDGQMKPVVFDYDDATITNASGLLTLYTNGE